MPFRQIGSCPDRRQPIFPGDVLLVELWSEGKRVPLEVQGLETEQDIHHPSRQTETAVLPVSWFGVDPGVRFRANGHPPIEVKLVDSDGPQSIIGLCPDEVLGKFPAELAVERYASPQLRLVPGERLRMRRIDYFRDPANARKEREVLSEFELEVDATGRLSLPALAYERSLLAYSRLLETKRPGQASRMRDAHGQQLSLSTSLPVFDPAKPYEQNPSLGLLQRCLNSRPTDRPRPGEMPDADRCRLLPLKAALARDPSLFKGATYRLNLADPAWWLVTEKGVRSRVRWRPHESARASIERAYRETVGREIVQRWPRPVAHLVVLPEPNRGPGGTGQRPFFVTHRHGEATDLDDFTLLPGDVVHVTRQTPRVESP